MPASPMPRKGLYGAVAAPVALVLMTTAGSALACLGCIGEGSEQEYLHAEMLAAWEASTGADSRQYAPERVVDFEHMRLELDIPDMDVPTMSAKQTLTFTATKPEMDSFTLNANQLTINNVYAIGRGQVVTHSYDDETLTLAFDPPLKRGDTGGVVIEYEINDPPEGLLWTPASDAFPGRPAQIHTQGQPETNNYWFPCHDSPNERLTTEILCTVPQGFDVSANGRLVSKETNDGRTTFHWNQDLPHVNYLVSLCVGQWDIVDITDRSNLPMPVYVPKGMGQYVQVSYGRTPAMVDAMSKALDEPYPWSQYGQVVVWNFAAGGMENTSVTTMYAGAILEHPFVERDRRRLDSLIAHELGHQWFGDQITCNTWDHIWLNEGFATYMESLWWEAADGYDGGYLFDTWQNNASSARRDRTPGKGSRPGLVHRQWSDPGDMFRNPSNPYPKGASILHMLRAKLGDEVFFEGLRAYVDDFKFKTVETSDFRRAMEDASGMSLDRFFHQWTVRPGTPEISITPKWNLAKKTLTVRVDQTQRIDAEHPAFAFELPLHIVTAEGVFEETIVVNERTTEFAMPLESEPTMVAVDPMLHTLASRTLKHPSSYLIEQLRNGPTVPSRLDAAIALREHPGKASVEALKSMVSDSSEHFAVRAEAAETLGELGAGAALLELFNAGVNGDSRVQVAMLEALTKSADEGAMRVLVATWNDRSANHRVREAALRGIGKLGDASDQATMDLVLAALEEDSYADCIRGAAIGALVEFNQPEAMAAIAPYTAPGHYERLRPVAMYAVAELQDHDPDLAYETISASLDDRNERARMTAARMLASLGDERALPELRRLSRSHRQPAFRDYCARMAKTLVANAAGEKPNLDLTKEIEELRQELEKLRLQVENDPAEAK